MKTAVTVLVALAPVLFSASSGAAQQVTRDEEATGTHWRLVTASGPVHVWRPRLYDPDTAGTLIFVHGYYVNVDEAWRQHHLAEQFRESKQNALFIVPEAPSSDEELVAWKNVDALLDDVRRLTKRRLPNGPIAALAFSGGFRTVAEWTKSDALDQIMLLDGLYENESDFAAWLKTPHRQHHARHNRLILVASETIPRTDVFVQRCSQVAARGALPEHAFELSPAERAAEVLYLRTGVEHTALVTGGRVIPLLLRLAPFPRVAGQSGP